MNKKILKQLFADNMQNLNKIELIRNEIEKINIFKNIFNNALKDFKEDKYKKMENRIIVNQIVKEIRYILKH